MSEQPPKVSDINPSQLIAYLDEQILKDVANHLFIKARLEKPVAEFSKTKDPESIRKILVILRDSGKITKDEASLVADSFNEYMKIHNITGSIDISVSAEKIKNTDNESSVDLDATEVFTVGVFSADELMQEIDSQIEKLKVADRKKIKKILEAFQEGVVKSVKNELLKKVKSTDESTVNKILLIVEKYLKTHDVEKKEQEISDRSEVKNKRPTKVVKDLKDLDLDAIESESQDGIQTESAEELKVLGQYNTLVDLGWTKKQIKSFSEQRREEIAKRGEKNPNSPKFKEIVSSDKNLGLNADAIFDRLTAILEKGSPYKDSDVKVFRGEKFLDKDSGMIFEVVDTIRTEEDPEGLDDSEKFAYYENHDQVLLEGPFDYETGKNITKKISNREFADLIANESFVSTTDKNPEVTGGSNEEIDSLEDEINRLVKQLDGLRAPKTNNERSLKEDLQKEVFEKRNKLKELVSLENKDSIIEGKIMRFIENAGIPFEYGDILLPINGGNEFIIKHPFTEFEGQTLYTYTYYKIARYNIKNPPKDIPKNKLEDFQYSERKDFKSEDITKYRVTKREYLGILLKTVEIEKNKIQEKRNLLELLKEEIKKRDL
ncbi:hypothetical protein IPJ63_01780 [Candidatus Nomurabacteria bacterium]|nr:MAG: hypothetical protein IPJ63_01780 [Candidatus Nomurabacteria bacterium]